MYIFNTFDAYFNFTYMEEAWKTGNLKDTAPEEMARRIIEEDTDALNAARSVTVGTLAGRCEYMNSDRIFFVEDYKSYLLNRYVEEPGTQV